MDNNFDKCLAFVLKEEGGNDDDPNDHGGRTSRGITQLEWEKYLLIHPGLPTDVWQASDADIRNIYHDSYWLPHCPNLPVGLDLVFFDFAVNAGPHQAIKTLQKALLIPQDGIWGPKTETALNMQTHIESVIKEYSDAREAFYKGLAQYPRYGKGWSGRNARCEHAALAMISVTPISPQANPIDIKVNVANGPATSAVIVASGTAVAAHYESPLIFLGVLGAAAIIGLIVHYFSNRKVI